MDRETLDRQDKFFSMILSEAIPGVPDALKAAYIERLEKDADNRRYSAFSATLRGDALYLHSLLSEGYGSLNGEKRQIKTTAIPLKEVRAIDVQTEMTDFGAETFRGTIHLYHPIAGWETPLQLPLKGPRRVDEQRHGMTAKTFTFAVIDALSIIQPKEGRG